MVGGSSPSRGTGSPGSKPSENAAILRAIDKPASILTILLAAGGQYALAVARDEVRGGLLYALALAALALTLVAQRRMCRREGCAPTDARRPPARLLIALAAAAAHVAALVFIFLQSPLWLLTAALGALSLALAVVAAAWPAAHPFPILRRRAELLAAGAIVLIGGALRGWDLEDVPSGVHGDETEFGLIALQVLRGGGPNPFGTMFLGDPALFAYLEAPFVAVFGPTILALRLPAAVSGTLTLAACYAFVRALFGIRTALLATTLLAGAAVHVHFSRLGLNVAQVPLFLLLTFYLLWRAYESDRGVWWLLAGMAAAGGAYFHFSGRLIPPIVAAFMLYLLAGRPRRWRTWSRQVGLLTLGATMVASPMVVQAAGQWHHLTEHVGGRLIWSEWGRVVAQHQTSDPLMIAWRQIKLNVLAFLSRPDAGEFYTFTGAALLNGLVAPFAVLGLALMIARFGDPRYALLAIWFWAVVLLGGALTYDSPQFHRLIPAVPAGLIGAALALDWLVDTWSRGGGRTGRPVLVTLAVLLTVAAGVADMAAYFGPWARAYPWAVPSAQARTIAALGPAYQIFVAGRPHILVEHGNTRFLAGDSGARNLDDAAAELPAPPLERPLAVLVNPGLQHYVPLLQGLYSSGQAIPVERPPGRLVLTLFTVPADPAARPWPADQGLSVELRPPAPGAPAVQGVDRMIASRLMSRRSPEPGRPFRATWRGQLVAPTDGSYRIELYTDGEATLRLDGRTVVVAEPTPEHPRSVAAVLDLAAGPHLLELDYRYERGPGTIELIWQPPGGERSIVPPAALRP